MRACLRSAGWKRDCRQPDLMMLQLLLAFLLLATFAPVSAVAQDGASIDEALEGFEEESPDETDALDDALDGFDDTDSAEPMEETNTPSEPSIWRLTGWTKFGSAVNFAHKAPEPGRTDHRGLSRLHLKAYVNLDITPMEKWRIRIGGSGFYDAAYTINGREKYTQEFLDSMERELLFEEVYIRGQLGPSLDIKLGRQIVIWGKSDNIRITDILNPLDLREIGMVDIEELREPRSMSKIDYYHGDWSFTAIAVHEIKFNEDPPFGSDFFSGSTPPPPEDIPGSTMDNTEFALAINGIFTGFDISLYAAWLFDDTAHAKLAPGASGIPSILRRHSKIRMVGAAGNIARGNWLIKGEAAYFDGLEFFNAPGEQKSRIDSLIGAEYSGITETTISLEIANRHLNGFDQAMKAAPDNAQENVWQSALRYQSDHLNSTLHATVVASFFGFRAEDGAFQRASLKYDLYDAVSVTGGVVLYQSGDSFLFQDIGDNDRLFLDIKYSF